MKIKLLSSLLAVNFLFFLLPSNLFFSLNNFALANGGSIVINEVSWAGSKTSGFDEWIELKNPTSSDISLMGFTLLDDGEEVLTFTNEIIKGGSFFLIEKREESTSVKSDFIMSKMSLANSGDFLELLDETGTIVDEVNSSGTMWPAGSSTSNASMSRVSSDVSGDEKTNWQTSKTGNGSLDSGGEQVVGTPGGENNLSDTDSESEGGNSGTNLTPEISIKLIEPDLPKMDDTVVLDIDCLDCQGVFVYGFTIDFDSDQLDFAKAIKGNILSEEGDVDTSFQYAIDSNNSDVLLVSEARLEEVKTGSVASSGTLATLYFDILELPNEASTITFKSDSFLGGINEDLDAKFTDFELKIYEDMDNREIPSNVFLGTDRYSFDLTWENVAGATKYAIERKDGNGIFNLLQETTENYYCDKQNIIPRFRYDYRIKALADDVLITTIEFSAEETRGLQGDFDRSDRVDGRDLEKLSKKWAIKKGELGYELQVDGNQDGKIDALDLFIIGADFGETFDI